MMKEVLAAGGVVYRKKENGQTEVLLIFRRDVWDLPKGKKEEGETVRECARREVAEETGLEELPRITADLPQTYHEYEREGNRYAKITRWFAMHTDADHPFTPQRSEGIERVAWTSLSEAKKKIGYENLRELLNGFNPENGSES